MDEMTTQPKVQSELDDYFPPDEAEARDGAIQEAMANMEAELAKFSADLDAAIDELLPNANAGKRKAVKRSAWGDEPYARLFEKNPAEYYIAKLKAFVENVEKKAAETAKSTPKKVKDMQNAGNEQSLIDDRDRYIRDEQQGKSQPVPADAPLAKPASEPQNSAEAYKIEHAPIDNTPLPEAKFVAWFDAFDGMGLKVSFTVRAARVSEGLKELDILKKYVFANGYSAQRAQSDPPSTANRRIGADPTGTSAPARQNGTSPASAPVRSFDPDADNKPASNEVHHEKVIEIEKVMAQDGKVQINLYAPDKPKYPVFYLKSDADKEEVWKHIDVDAMELAKRYTFKATVDYVLSAKLNSKGNPYKNLRAIHPE